MADLPRRLVGVAASIQQVALQRAHCRLLEERKLVPANVGLGGLDNVLDGDAAQLRRLSHALVQTAHAGNVPAHRAHDEEVEQPLVLPCQARPLEFTGTHCWQS